MSGDLGEKIKELRTSKKMTLKDLSEKTDLSIGYLSQLERGLTSVAIASLESIANALDVDLNYFFAPPVKNNGRIIRSYEREVSLIENSRFIYYNLTNHKECKKFSATLITVLPGEEIEEVSTYSHEGEEFVYVLEGILTVFIENQRYELYPGDCWHINSMVPHNWNNYTNKIVKLLSIHSPMVFSAPEDSRHLSINKKD